MKNIKQNIICYLIYGGFACCLAFVLITNSGNNDTKITFENKSSESIAQGKETKLDTNVIERETQSNSSNKLVNKSNNSNQNEVKSQNVEINDEIDTQPVFSDEEKTLATETVNDIIKNDIPNTNKDTTVKKEEQKPNTSSNNTKPKEEQTEEPVKVVETPSSNDDKPSTSDTTVKPTIPEKPVVNISVIEKTVTTVTNKIILIDKSNGASCAQAIEYFYEDNNYRYYFTCIKSPSMYVIVNGKEYGLVYALKNNIVTIKELESNGYYFAKKANDKQVR